MYYSVGDATIAMRVQGNSESYELHTLLTDHLGGTVKTIWRDGVVSELSYSAWGRRGGPAGQRLRRSSTPGSTRPKRGRISISRAFMTVVDKSPGLSSSTMSVAEAKTLVHSLLDILVARQNSCRTQRVVSKDDHLPDIKMPQAFVWGIPWRRRIVKVFRPGLRSRSFPCHSV